MELTREKAVKDLEEYVDSTSLLKHSLAVEAAMLKMSEVFNEDKNIWGICGLLHDIDFQKYPEKHCEVGYDILIEKGYPEDFCTAIKGHNEATNTKRETNMAKSLYAVDQLSSFIVAVALVRPEKFEGMSVKSVKKKLKDKAFARAVDRDLLLVGADELGIELNELIQYLIDGLTSREKELADMGLSLL